MIKAVIFDIGGVVVADRSGREFGAVLAEVEERTAKALRVGNGAFRAVWKKGFPAATGGSISTAEFLSRISTALHRPPEKIRRAHTEAFVALSLLNRPVVDVALLLRKRGYVTAALSNAMAMDFRSTARTGAYAPFSPLVLSYRVKCSKPDPRIYRIMLDRLGLAPHRCVFIDDFPKNVTAARHLGLHAILYRSVPGMVAGLGRLGVRV